MVDQVLEEAKARMRKTVEFLSHEFATIRAGRASPSILDKVRVEYYGALLPINQVATISVPEPRLLVISPWDKALLREIEKAISRSDLGLMPMNDGNVIRLSIPSLTMERRRELAKLVGKKSEEGKVAIRNIRREIMEVLKKQKSEGKISEDAFEKAEERVQEVTDKYIEEIDEMHRAKEKEIMEE